MGRMMEGLRSSQDSRDAKDTPVFQEVLSHLGPERTVVDIGAGVGRYTIPFAESGCHVWAIEPSKPMQAHLLQALAAKQLIAPPRSSLCSAICIHSRRSSAKTAKAELGKWLGKRSCCLVR